MICIYHSKDLDGIVSGAIVKRKYPDCKLIGWDYGEPIPDEIVLPDELIMVDVTFPIPIMHNLRYKLTVIDHHKSFIEGWKEATKYDSHVIAGKMESGKAACELTWEYLFPTIRVPVFIELLGKYDTWREAGTTEWSEWILPFQYGMRTLVSKPEDVDFNIDIYKTTLMGDSIIKHVAATDKYVLSRYAFVIDFEGYRTLCVNLGGVSTGTFDSVYDPLKHDLMLAFSYTGSFWNVSLRSKNDVDCSALAKKYGGGGHAQAAGFEVQDINQLIKNNGKT